METDDETHRQYLKILHDRKELEKKEVGASHRTRQRIRRKIENYELLLAEAHLLRAVNALNSPKDAPSRCDPMSNDGSNLSENDVHLSPSASFDEEKTPPAEDNGERDEMKLQPWVSERTLTYDSEAMVDLMLQAYHDKHKQLSLLFGAPIAMPFQKAWHVQFEVSSGRETIDFGRMQDIADVHQCVIHGALSHRMGFFALQEIEVQPLRRRILWRLAGYGGLSVAIGFIAFGEQPWDILPTFILGMILGFMQLVMAPASSTLTNLFPFLASFTHTLLARVMGAIRVGGMKRFCWPAIVSGSLANILPAYAILIAAVELQGASTATGSIRLLASLAYTIMLGFGILSGSEVFGERTPGTQNIPLTDPEYLTSREQGEPCRFDDWTPVLGQLGEYHLHIVKAFAIVLLTISAGVMFQARWKQMLGMSLVTMFSYLIFAHMSSEFPLNGALTYLVSTFVGGLLVQAYSKWSEDLAVILLTPALFISVPGGYLAQVSMDVALGNFGADSILEVFYGVLQAAIGVSVGLCLSSLLAHPQGPRVPCRCEAIRDRWSGAEVALSSHW